MRKKFYLLLLCLPLMLCACSADGKAPHTHRPVTDPAVSPTCTRDGLTAGSHCEECGTQLTAQERIPMTGHTPVADPAVPATAEREGLTAGSHCGICGEVLTPQERIPASGEVEATVMPVKGGADAIVTLTFDDGIYDTAVLVDAMLEGYGLRGSCMMIAERVDFMNLEAWRTLFAKGNLEPENHSMTHMVLPSDGWAASNGGRGLSNNTEENYRFELLDSKTKLEKELGYSIIGFAPSNNTLSRDAWQIVKDNYYAIRLGERGLQNLNPDESTNPGGWFNLKMRGLYDAKASGSSTKADALCAYVDEAVRGKGWLITMCHGVSDTDGDVTVSEADRLFAHIAAYQDGGKLWSATFGEAIRYLREYQVSKAHAALTEPGKISVRVTYEKWQLRTDLFNHPLTVRVALPDGWSDVKPGEGIGSTFVQEGQRYVYVDVTPNAKAPLVLEKR